MALIANLRHYLSDDLSLVKIPAPAAALGDFWAVWLKLLHQETPMMKIMSHS